MNGRHMCVMSNGLFAPSPPLADMTDWIKTNLCVFLDSMPGVNGVPVKVHQGFFKAFSALTNQSPPATDVRTLNLADVLRDLIKETRVKDQDGFVLEGPARIMCCGHSLGGALAMLCAAWAAETYPLAQVSLITFGQVRVCAAATACTPAARTPQPPD